MSLPINSLFHNIPRLNERLKKEPEMYWQERGIKRALELFHLMAERVPAYKDVLKKNNIRHERIRTVKDFTSVPPIDKQSYLQQYPLSAVCWDGVFDRHAWTISSTSGSTGEPFYFPRDIEQIKQYAAVAELYLLENFSIHKKTTLYIDAFPMGPWIGGVFTYETIRFIAETKKYPLSIITPGINKVEILKAIKKFGHEFDQIIIGCYGPFLKDALDDGKREGMDWKQYPVRFIFSAEGFSEEFRDYVVQTCGTEDIYRATLNHYGTVDLGTMAHETPVSIAVRRAAIARPRMYEALFGVKHKLPTLCQYIPELFYFEEIDGNLLCSAASGIPLVRYDLKDHGGVRTLSQVKKEFVSHDQSFSKLLTDSGLRRSLWQLPFVFVYERSDFSVSLYAFQVYPETVRRALLDPSIAKYVTGKCTLMVSYDKKQNQYLEIFVEMQGGVKPSQSTEKNVQSLIVKRLLKENSEYAKTYGEIGERLMPIIRFCPYEDAQHFRPGTKQKWVKK